MLPSSIEPEEVSKKIAELFQTLIYIAFLLTIIYVVLHTFAEAKVPIPGIGCITEDAIAKAFKAVYNGLGYGLTVGSFMAYLIEKKSNRLIYTGIGMVLLVIAQLI